MENNNIKFIKNKYSQNRRKQKNVIRNRIEIINNINIYNSDQNILSDKIEEKNDTKKEVDEVYSNHIFMIPFEIKKNFKLSEDWEEDIIEDEINSHIYNEEQIGKALKRSYMLMHYFNDDAKKTILNTKSTNKEDIIDNYYFKPLRKLQNEKGENGIYRITLDACKNQENESDEGIEFVYDLELTDIRLRKYKYQEKNKDDENYLYLLMIYTQNKKYNNLKDIKKINQFGRRMLSPWIPSISLSDKNEIKDSNELKSCDVNINYTECAKSISIIIGKIKIGDKDELNYLDFWKEKYSRKELLNEQYEKIKENVDKFIISKEEYKKIINEQRKTSIICGLINYKKSDIEKAKIKFLNDDRMFVCYLIKNNKLINSLKKFDEKKFQYSYEYSDQVSNELYSIIYIDNEDSSCKSRTMRLELLRKAIYSRWIDDGTIHAVTQHSFGCITTQDAPSEPVIEPFLVEYVEMASIVLMQRYQLLRFAQRAGDKSQRIDAKNLQKLQKRYILFKNKFLLFEVTPQEQGYELYRKLQEELYVFEEKQELDDQLQSLYEYANVEQQKKLNRIAMIIGGLTLLVTFMSFVWERI